MSIEGFLLKRKRFRTKYSIYQLLSDDEHFDLNTALALLKSIDSIGESHKEFWTVVPPGYRWELVK